MINENVSKRASAGAIDIKQKRKDGSKSGPKYTMAAPSLLLLDSVIMENRQSFIDLAVHRIVVLQQVKQLGIVHLE